MNQFVTIRWLLAIMVLVCASGCGSTKGRLATEQLLASDAVDRAVSQIDFRALSDRTVYFDTQYLQNDAKNRVGYVDGNYVISSLRQQMLAGGCLIKDKQEDAEFVVEARIGTLGADAREIVYGIPAASPLTAAASAASAFNPSIPPVPTIPEISIARREDHSAAAKIGCFAYHRETRQPVWQSGLAVARSKAKDTYLLGAGPFQKGEIYNGLQFADERLAETLLPNFDDGPRSVALSKPHLFKAPHEFDPKVLDGEIMQAGHEEPEK